VHVLVSMLRASRGSVIPAEAYVQAKADLDVNVIAAVKALAEKVCICILPVIVAATYF
jgi:hypothetical protein